MTNPKTSLSTTTRAPASSDRCPECGGGGASTAGHVDGLRLVCSACVRAHEERERREQLRVRFNEIVRAGHVTDDLRFSSFGQSRAEFEALNSDTWQLGRRWLKEGQKNLFLYGAVGVGKTYLARCCLNQAFVSGRSVGEVTCTRLTKTGILFGEGGGSFSFWQRVEFLLIDDIGSDDWTVGRLRALWEVLNARMARRCRTIITSNLDSAALLQVLSQGGSRAGCADASLAISAMDRIKPASIGQFRGGSLR